MTIDLFRKISEITSQGKACVLVTVAETEGSGPMTVGKTMLVPDPPEAKQCIHESFYAYVGRAPIDESSYVIVCTPSHANDYDVVRTLLNRGVRSCYLGLLASSAKKADFIACIEKEYGRDVDFSHLYSLVGLDIGGASPEEIALSVAAEISAVKYGKNEIRHMRDR